MSTMHHELLVKRKLTGGDLFLRILSIVLFLVFLRFIFYTKWMIFFVFLAGYLVYLAFKRTDVEFEYAFMQDELRVDKIFSKSKRKSCGTIQMSDVEIVAPEDDDELKRYENEDYKIVDFSSRIPYDMRYVAFVRKDSGIKKVIFDPDEDIVKEMRRIAPNKVKMKVV